MYKKGISKENLLTLEDLILLKANAQPFVAYSTNKTLSYFSDCVNIDKAYISNIDHFTKKLTVLL